MELAPRIKIRIPIFYSSCQPPSEAVFCYLSMLTPIKSSLEKHTIVILNEALKKGFTQLPNYILRDRKLSFGARLVYAVLLSYAWQEDSCFPGQERIGEDLGVSRQMINKYLEELKKTKYITWERRGLGKTNVYFILDYKPLSLGEK